MDTTKITQSSDVIIKYLLENGPKVAGALAILVVGIIVARIVGNLTQHWLGKRELDPPLRMLITRRPGLQLTRSATVYPAVWANRPSSSRPASK